MTYRHLLRWPRTGAGQALVERGGGLCHRFVEISHLPGRRLLLGKDEEDPETYHHELFFVSINSGKRWQNTSKQTKASS